MRPKDHPALKLHFISINADYMNSFDSTRLGLVMAIAVLKDFSDTSKALFRGSQRMFQFVLTRWVY
jgi:hypothetical protein